MATLQDLQAAVAAEKTVTASAVTLLQGLHQSLVDLRNTTDGATTGPALDGIIADLKASTDALAAAVSTNTETPPASTSASAPASSTAPAAIPDAGAPTADAPSS